MKNIKEFIAKFIVAEHKCNKGEYNFNLSDKDYELLRKEASSFFHSHADQHFWRGIEEDELEDMSEGEKEEYAENVLSATPRTLFQIKKYKNFELGGNLKRIVTSEDLYACYVSYPSKGGRALYFSSIYFITKTNEGLKIIYRKGFDSDKILWYHSHDLEVLQVLSTGNLVAVEKHQAPEEATSLTDYNVE
ncbi:MAG: hypothetical protein HRT69_11755 [Flavobacteriaceae bacterium]|nr:hypothetical protein [Flavobacteriaceae bacterium]